jgi:hypothetical protein
MAVLVRMTLGGMDADSYDLWESRGQYETWFNENVKPNVPGEIQQEVIELHGVVRP